DGSFLLLLTFNSNGDSELHLNPILFYSLFQLFYSQSFHFVRDNRGIKEMTEVAKLLYIVVEEDEETKGNEESSFRYTRPVLQSTLQLMGCKARHAFKISQRVFEIMRTKCLGDTLADIGVIQWGKDTLKFHPLKENNRDNNNRSDKMDGSNHVVSNRDGSTRSKPFESYKKRTTVVIKRRMFIDVVCDALSEYKYVGPNQRADFVLACRIRERKESVTVLLCGTSGCGKSTLSALLTLIPKINLQASRLGITTVISTDSIRHMMRSFVDEKQNPLLWSSTYHAGEHLDPLAVSEAKAKRKAKKEVSVSDTSTTEAPKEAEGSSSTKVDLIGSKQMAIEGFKAQSEMVIDSLDRLITAWEERKESCVANSLGSKRMFQLIQRQGSSRHLMALLNNDGSVAKAWPVHSVDADGKPILDCPAENGPGIPMYGPLQIGKAEPVNLQFGKFGISAWPNDLGGTSHAGSVDDSRGELTDNGSRYYSSCCSSPKVSEGHAKELKEELSVSGSDGEVDDARELDSDEDLSDNAKEHMHEEVPFRSFTRLNASDIQENGYFTDIEFESKTNLSDTITSTNVDRYKQNLDRFLRTKREAAMDPVVINSGIPKEKRLPSSRSLRVRGRSYSISTSAKEELLTPPISRTSSPPVSSGSRT
ncbi:hypothetical protein Ccrd_021575, partial [Cynara cardunculus var. scolymus]